MTKHLTFTLRPNDHDLQYDEDDVFSMVKSVADGSIHLREVTRWFTDRVRPAG